MARPQAAAAARVQAVTRALSRAPARGTMHWERALAWLWITRSRAATMPR